MSAEVSNRAELRLMQALVRELALVLGDTERPKSPVRPFTRLARLLCWCRARQMSTRNREQGGRR